MIGAFLEGTGADIELWEGDFHCYLFSQDVIKMLPLTKHREIYGKQNYVVSFFHELSHWAGGYKRLARTQSFAYVPSRLYDKDNIRDTPMYAYEEVVACASASYLTWRYFNDLYFHDQIKHLKGYMRVCESVSAPLGDAVETIQYLQRRAGFHDAPHYYERFFGWLVHHCLPRKE